MINLSKIQAEMSVKGSDGKHVGTVDNINEHDIIQLSKDDDTPDGKHHWIPVTWIYSIEDKAIRLSMPAAEVMQQWREHV